MPSSSPRCTITPIRLPTFNQAHEEPPMVDRPRPQSKTEAPNDVAREVERWEKDTLNPTLDKMPERMQEFTTTSSVPVDRLYTPVDLPDYDYVDELGFPGEFPYTRGVHATMHRGRLWTMRMFAGFGTAEETNA